MPPREDRPLFAVLLCLGAYLAFTGIDTSAKWLVTHDIPTAQVVFTRYQVHLVLAVSLAMATAQPLFASRARGLELLRGAALLTSTVMNFWALAYLPLAMTSAMSSAVTSSETIGASPPAFEDVASAACASSSCFSRAGMSP